MPANNNCDGAGPHLAGVVKKMATGGGGNMILCRACWARELQYRADRNRNLSGWAKFDLPTWKGAEVYEI